MYLKNNEDEVVECTYFLVKKTKLLTHKFIGGKWLKQAKAEADATVDPEELEKDYKSRFTLELELDYEGVTLQELVQCCTSTTTFNKQFYNNNIKKWSKEEAEEKCKETLRIKVREDIIDAASSKTRLTFRERTLRHIEKAKKQGKSKEQIKAELETLMELL